MTLDEAAPPRLRRSRGEMLRELGLVVGLYMAYSATRLAASGSWDVAKAHARGILGFERWLGIDVEHSLNHALAQHTSLEVLSSYWYQSAHFLVTPTLLVVLFFRRPTVYKPARTALIAATVLALFGYFFFPTAPPRLLGEYVDTVSESAAYGWWPTAEQQAASGANSVTNQVAAMPSMHVGWALWVSLVLAVLARRTWLKIAAFGYVTTTALVVTVTGNHWVLDAVAGAGLVLVVSWVCARSYGLWPRREPAAAERTPTFATADDEPFALASSVEPPPELDSDASRD
ncbi:phosphatase PAP2 family protein [Cellulomonas composti]|uniref:Inositolphosphotransferase Aur1/Ipt1 domain-containing protein n=1 Tax=Cellulomonas composti TaxID=266130 RepID=A0A511J6V6_9CELL|nr:phosphatase PAP2 family protein [Cellulomonas composti]GEL93714.1 hypothetical protein CCO02nite_03720 [Cellulomonas composti]